MRNASFCALESTQTFNGQLKPRDRQVSTLTRMRLQSSHPLFQVAYYLFDFTPNTAKKCHIFLFFFQPLLAQAPNWTVFKRSTTKPAPICGGPKPNCESSSRTMSEWDRRRSQCKRKSKKVKVGTHNNCCHHPVIVIVAVGVVAVVVVFKSQ